VRGLLGTGIPVGGGLDSSVDSDTACSDSCDFRDVEISGLERVLVDRTFVSSSGSDGIADSPRSAESDCIFSASLSTVSMDDMTVH
jgi:hypothetical protein